LPVVGQIRLAHLAYGLRQKNLTIAAAPILSFAIPREAFSEADIG